MIYIFYILKNNRGFLLVDSLIAIVLIAIAFTPILMLAKQNTINTVFNRNNNRAVDIANSELQQIQRLDNELNTNLPKANKQIAAAAAYPAFTVTYSTPTAGHAYLPTNTKSTITPVQVIVSWNDTNGIRTVSLIAYHISSY